jgi:hypothetical protein
MLSYFQEPLDGKWERNRGFSKIVLEIDIIQESCFWSFGIYLFFLKHFIGRGWENCMRVNCTP